MSIRTSSGSNLFLSNETLTSAQLLALNTNPILLVNSPGIGKYIFPIAYALTYNFGTTAYHTPAKTNNCFFGWTGQAVNSVNSPIAVPGWGVFIANAFSCSVFGIVGNAANVGITTIGELNQGMQFGVPNPLTLGDGTLTIALLYTVLGD